MMMYDCDNCGSCEERVFKDTYTGMSVCLHCLSEVASYVTNSPFTEGDNLQEELDKAGRN